MKKTFGLSLMLLLFVYFLLCVFLPNHVEYKKEKLFSFSAEKIFKEFENKKYIENSFLKKKYRYFNYPEKEYSFLILKNIPNQFLRIKFFHPKKQEELLFDVTFSSIDAESTIVTIEHTGVKTPFYLNLLNWLRKKEWDLKTKNLFMKLEERLKEKYLKENYTLQRSSYLVEEKLNLIGISQEVAFDNQEIQEAILESIAKVKSYLLDYISYEKEKIGPEVVLYENYDEDAQKLSFYVGYMVKDKEIPLKDEDDIYLKSVYVKAEKVDYQGKYKDLEPAYQELKNLQEFKKALSSKKEVLEIFPEGFKENSITNKVEIYIPLK